MTACLGLALALLITCAVTRAETATFERSLERACEQGEFEAITGPQTDRQLDPLRTWNP